MVGISKVAFFTPKTLLHNSWFRGVFFELFTGLWETWGNWDQDGNRDSSKGKRSTKAQEEGKSKRGRQWGNYNSPDAHFKLLELFLLQLLVTSGYAYSPVVYSALLAGACTGTRFGNGDGNESDNPSDDLNIEAPELPN